MNKLIDLLRPIGKIILYLYPNKIFNDWCDDIPPFTGSKNQSSLEGDYNSLSKTHKKHWARYLCQKYNERINNGEIIGLDIDKKFLASTFCIDGVTRGYKLNIGALNVKVSMTGTLELRNLSIGQLNFLVPMTICDIYIENCNIGEIKTVIHSTKKPLDIELNIRKTRIGKLIVASKSIKKFEMKRGCILDIECPTPDQDNPFTGSIVFKRVFFPRMSRFWMLDNAQPYRNIRHHLTSLDNLQMANMIYSRQLAVEKKDDKWLFDKPISEFYELFSNYGSSTLLPLLWLFSAWAIFYLVYLLTGGAVLSSGENAEIYQYGWRRCLADPFDGNHYRALLLSTQQVVNPLGIVGYRSLVMAKTHTLAIWGAVHSLFSVIFIALFIFALRRRFKLQ